MKTAHAVISSTFRDVHAGRDHLVTGVFPELREWVEQLELEFFYVDLRFRLRRGYGGQGGVPEHLPVWSSAFTRSGEGERVFGTGTA